MRMLELIGTHPAPWKRRARDLCFSLALLVFCFGSFSSVDADDTGPQLQRQGEEMLLFQDIPSVFGVSKYEQKVNEAPSAVNIVTSSEIKKYGYRTLADVLQSQSGFFITYDRVYKYAGVRGFSRPGDLNTRILLLVDGHRINDGIFDQALIGTEFPVDIDLIDRIEIIRGPSSSLYGSNAFFGVVNVITKRGRDLKGVEVSGEAASYDTYKGRLSYGNRFNNGLEVILSGTGSFSDGQDLYFQEFDSPETNFGRANGVDGDDFFNFFSNVSYKDFTLQSVFHSRKKGIPTAPAGRIFNDPTSEADDIRAYLNLKYDHIFDNQWGLMARLYYDYYEYEGTYPLSEDVFSSQEISRDPHPEGSHPRRLLVKDLAQAQWVGGEAQVNKRFFDNHKLIVGAEFRSNFVMDQFGQIEDPPERFFQSEKDSLSWALYVQDEFHILDNLILNAGLRFDYYDLFGGTTSPRVALIYTPFPASTFKLLYGRAFRAPNAYELYYTINSPGNLDPEKIDTYELVWEQSIRERFRLRTSLFHYNIHDLITLEEDLVYRNVDKANASGFEVELEGKLFKGLEGYVSYTFQNAEDGRTDKRLTNSPQHMAKLGLIAPLYRDYLFGSINLRYVDSRLTLKGNETDGYLVTDVTLFSQNLFNRRLEFSASVYNLFDTGYGHPASQEHRQNVIEQDGRTWRIKATYAF